jgi:type II secretory ATPase GspE/PulE/Tfp pilus assembly ATPase PilB-like protein
MVMPNSPSRSSPPGTVPLNLGEILVEVGVITSDQLRQAREAAHGSEKDLPRVLVELGLTTEEKIMKGIGIKAKVPYFTSLEGLYTSDSANIVSEELARRLQIVPLFKIDNVATVAMVNPMDVFIIDSLVKTTGYKIDPVVCMRTTIFETIDKLYGGLESSPMSSIAPLPPPIESNNAPSASSPFVINYSPRSNPDPAPVSPPPSFSTPPPMNFSVPAPAPVRPPPMSPISAMPPILPPPVTPPPAPAAPPKPAPMKPASPEDLNKLMDSLRKQMPTGGQSMSQMDQIQKDIQKSSGDMPIVQLVDAIFKQAVGRKASDIHIEPFKDHTEVRLRIDGVLRQVMTVPKDFESAIVSRIKVLANLDITESRQPQDGRVMTEVEKRQVDLRISTLPIIHGEKVVIRILDKGSTVFEMSKLGFSEYAQNMFMEAMDAPNGIILVTGPTGSGKSTTLYTGLTILNQPDVNIITMEDPVEYQLPRVNQVQVNTKVGLTFAKGLRSILRQDPDIIMVGEIRDLETAEIAIQAALTGHLVLSTLHTNDAPSAITRLRYMRVEPFLISASVLLIIAQRLVRVLCPTCKEPFQPPEALMEKLKKSAPPDVKEWNICQPKGCDQCGQSGYRGRKGLYEILKMTNRLRDMTVDPKASLENFRDEARANGMRTLFEEGTAAVLRGETSVEEMMRVCTLDE